MCWYNQQTAHDGQAYVHLVDRVWQVSKDDAVLREFYSSVKRCVQFMRSLDQNGDGIIEVFERESPNYPWSKGQVHDDWQMSGTACHVATLWLATLKIAERMAMAMGDADFAEVCSDLANQSAKALEEILWNDEVGCYYLYRDLASGEESDTVLADQLVGECYARLHGLASLLPDDRVKTILETLWRLNVAATPHGIMCSVRPAGTTDADAAGPSGNVMGSYGAQVPAVLFAMSGDAARGLEIARRIWHQCVFGLGMAWDLSLAITPGGEWYCGHEYWHNTMLWILPLAVLGEDLSRTTAPGGFVHAVIQAACQGSDV